jgi:hypothetical protein
MITTGDLDFSQTDKQLVVVVVVGSGDGVIKPPWGQPLLVDHDDDGRAMSTFATILQITECPLSMVATSC